MQTLTLVYGLAKGETERYMETLLSTQLETPEAIEALKVRASKDGFHSFRITTCSGEKPNFAKAVA